MAPICVTHADEATSPAVQTSSTSITPPVVSTTSVAPPATSTAAMTTLPVVTIPPVPAAPPPAPSVLPGVMPKSPKSFLNEMTGTVLSVDDDGGVVRITVQGGFNVDFSFDGATQTTENGKPIKPEDLGYGDKIVVRYAGKDLKAREIERTAQATSPIDTH